MWRIDREALESIAVGAGILGTGGGGNPYLGKLKARRLLEKGKEINVMSLDELSDDARVLTVGFMGAPTVGIEKIDRGTEALGAVRAIEDYMGERIDAVIPAEIGGANSIEPMIVGASADLPVLDADGMGRAFPQMPMITYFIYGVSCFPCALCDEKGNKVVFTEGVDAHWLERLSRAVAVQMGGMAGAAVAYMSGADAKRTAIADTLTLARDLGDQVRAARSEKREVVRVILERTRGVHLMDGKIVDVERRTSGGFARGQMVVAGLDGNKGQEMEIAFQNENLVAWLDGEVVVTVPDLICVVSRDDGEPITTEMLRYGQRVAVLGIPCSPKLRSARALEVVGPPAFGYELDFVPIEQRFQVEAI